MWRRAPFRFGQPSSCNTIAGSDSRSGAGQAYLFQMNCAHCHGEDARGDEGPDLHNLHKSDARIRQVITAGIKGEMPSFGKKLGKPELQQLTAYLQTLQG
jgi:cytochrome c oxidase cbb3-type subunit III